MDIRFTVEIIDNGDRYEIQVYRPGKAGAVFETDRLATPEDAIREVARDMLEDPNAYL